MSYKITAIRDADAVGVFMNTGEVRNVTDEEYMQLESAGAIANSNLAGDNPAFNGEPIAGGSTGGIDDAPLDGKLYGRWMGAWTAIENENDTVGRIVVSYGNIINKETGSVVNAFYTDSYFAVYPIEDHPIPTNTIKVQYEIMDEEGNNITIVDDMVPDTYEGHLRFILPKFSHIGSLLHIAIYDQLGTFFKDIPFELVEFTSDYMYEIDSSSLRVKLIDNVRHIYEVKGFITSKYLDIDLLQLVFIDSNGTIINNEIGEPIYITKNGEMQTDFGSTLDYDIMYSLSDEQALNVRSVALIRKDHALDNQVRFLNWYNIEVDPKLTVTGMPYRKQISGSNYRIINQDITIVSDNLVINDYDIQVDAMINGESQSVLFENNGKIITIHDIDIDASDIVDTLSITYRGKVIASFTVKQKLFYHAEFRKTMNASTLLRLRVSQEMNLYAGNYPLESFLNSQIAWSINDALPTLYIQNGELKNGWVWLEYDVVQPNNSQVHLIADDRTTEVATAAQGGGSMMYAKGVN